VESGKLMSEVKLWMVRRREEKGRKQAFYRKGCDSVIRHVHR
jgi:hypothetical protein